MAINPNFLNQLTNESTYNLTFFSTFSLLFKEISSLSFLKVCLSNIFFSEIVILNLQLMPSSFSFVRAMAKASAESSGFGGFLSSKLYITASRTSFLDAFPDPAMVNFI